MATSKRVLDRITKQLKHYQPILAGAKDRDVNEADTATIIGGILSDVLGYDKFSEITKELAIKSSYVDLAVRVGSEVRFLVEAKAIGVPLKDAHVKQAIDYGANHGIEWAILTNGVKWRIYKIHFKKPIDKSLTIELNLLEDSPNDIQLLECLGNLSREGFDPSSMATFFQQQQAISKFSVAALLLTDSVVTELRRELRRIYSGIKIDEELLRSVLREEVVKRELVESDEATQAGEALKKAIKASQKSSQKPKPADKEADRAPLQGVVPQVPASAANLPAAATPESPPIAARANG
jgi:Type I restriction enzyme R protein N terminus (HSDR_N)